FAGFGINGAVHVHASYAGVWRQNEADTGKVVIRLIGGYSVVMAQPLGGVFLPFVERATIGRTRHFVRLVATIGLILPTDPLRALCQRLRQVACWSKGASIHIHTSTTATVPPSSSDNSVMKSWRALTYSG